MLDFQLQMTCATVETLYARIASLAERQPDKTAMHWGSETLSYAAWHARLSALLAAIQRAGIAKGDFVGIAAKRKVDYLTAVIAAMGAGAVAVPLPLGEDELKWTIEQAQPKIILCAESLASDCQLAGYDASKLLPIFAAPGTLQPTTMSVSVTLNDPAMLLYTSGTTGGVGTGVIQSHKNLAATVNYMNEVMQLTPEVVEYVVAPITHAFGFGRCRAVLHAGGTLVFDDGMFHPGKIVAAIKSHGCNALSAVSTGFAILLDHFEQGFHDVGRQIRWIEIGSLPLSVAHKEKLLSVAPNAAVFMNYGLTEAMRSTLLNLRGEQRRIATVGRPSPGIEIQTVSDDGQARAVGEVGEIAIKGDNVAAGFHKNPEKWRARFRDGWLFTGDTGFLDEAGYLHFVGRKDDLINVGGEKFSPLVVEDQLTPLLQDRVYCLCGVPDPDNVLGQIPVLCVEGRAGHSLEEIQVFLSGKVNNFMLPRRLFHLECLDKTKNGKLKRNQIRKQIEERL